MDKSNRPEKRFELHELRSGDQAVEFAVVDVLHHNPASEADLRAILAHVRERLRAAGRAWTWVCVDGSPIVKLIEVLASDPVLGAFFRLQPDGLHEEMNSLKAVNEELWAPVLRAFFVSQGYKSPKALE